MSQYHINLDEETIRKIKELSSKTGTNQNSWVANLVKIGLSCVQDSHKEDFEKNIIEELKKVKPLLVKEKKIPDCVIKKQKLIIWAEEKKDKPRIKSEDTEESKLSCALYRYTNPKNNSFDIKFYRKILKLRPDWFNDKHNITKES